MDVTVTTTVAVSATVAVTAVVVSIMAVAVRNYSWVESTVCGLYADKDKNEARCFFTSSVGTSEYQIRYLRRNSIFDEYGDIRNQTQKSSSALQVCS